MLVLSTMQLYFALAIYVLLLPACSSGSPGQKVRAATYGPFRHDVEAARDAVEREPPSYFLAAGVVSSCAYCHR